jgi:hypothetical protein
VMTTPSLGGHTLKHRSYALLSAIVFTLACGISAAAEAQPAPATATYGERSASAPKELAAFSFLVGKWEGMAKNEHPDGTPAEVPVTWIGRYVLDGTAIADEFHSSTPDGSPYLGITLRQYDASKKAWIVEYLDVSGSFLRTQVSATSGSVTVDGKNVVVITEAPDTWIRETYRVESHDHFTYGMELSNDRGRTWSVSPLEIALSRTE